MHKQFLIAVFLVYSACATPTASSSNERPPLPPPGPSQMHMLGHDASVQLAAAFAQARGYEELQLQEVSEPTMGMLRVRFGLLPRDGKHVLTLEVDRSLRKVVKAEEVDGVSAKVLETP